LGNEKISSESCKILFFTLLSLVAILSLFKYFYALPFAPEQPIAFSHVTHVQKNEMDCQYCHIYARKSSVAGVPSVQKCVGCHEMIALDHPEVQKLLAYWDKREPIPWQKVYNLPDFVYFSHRMHLNADLACKQCHGPVSQMERVKKVSSLEMGWCLQCHKKMDAPIDCGVCHK